MSNPNHVSSLIGDIYDAIHDQSQWSAVLGKAARFVGAQAGALLWRHPISRAAGFIRTFGIAPRYLDLYAERYAKQRDKQEAITLEQYVAANKVLDTAAEGSPEYKEAEKIVQAYEKQA